MRILQTITCVLLSSTLIRAVPIKNYDGDNMKRDVKITDTEVLAPTVVVASLAALTAGYATYSFTMTKALDQELATRAKSLTTLVDLMENMRAVENSDKLSSADAAKAVKDTYNALVATFKSEIQLAKRRLSTKGANALSEIDRKGIERYQSIQEDALKTLQKQGSSMSPKEMVKFADSNKQIWFDSEKQSGQATETDKALDKWYTEQQNLIQSAIETELTTVSTQLATSLDKAYEEAPTAAEAGSDVMKFAEEGQAVLYNNAMQDALNAVRKALKLEAIWFAYESTKVDAGVSTLSARQQLFLSTLEENTGKAFKEVENLQTATLEELGSVLQALNFKDFKELDRKAGNELSKVFDVLEAKLKAMGISDAAREAFKEDVAGDVRTMRVLNDNPDWQAEIEALDGFKEESPRLVQIVQTELDAYVATGISKEALDDGEDLSDGLIKKILDTIAAEHIGGNYDEWSVRTVWRLLVQQKLGYFEPVLENVAKSHIDAMNARLSADELAEKAKNPLKEDIQELLTRLKDEGFVNATEDAARDLWSRLAAAAKF